MDYTAVDDKMTCQEKRGSAFALITRMIFPISHQGNSGGQRDKYSCIKELV